MAAFWWDGFDLYGSNANAALNYASGSVTLSTTAGTFRTGTTSITASNLVKDLSPGNMSTVWVGAAIRRKLFGEPLFQFMDSSTEQFNVYCQDDGSVRIRKGSTAVTGGISAAGVVQQDVYAHIAIRAKAHNSSGECDVYVNETLVLSVSGLDLTGTANDYSNRILINGGYIDDLWFSTQNEQDCRVIEQLPTGAGNYSQFGSGGGGANYTNVDETTPNGDTSNDYNSASVVGYMDTFTFPALGVTGDVKGVKALINCRGDVGSVSLRPVLRISTTDYPAATTETVNTTYTYRGATVWTENPATTGAWSQAAAEGAELGYEKR